MKQELNAMFFSTAFLLGISYSQDFDSKSVAGSTFYNVCFSDSLHGWFLANNTSILSTYDGGKTLHLDSISNITEGRYNLRFFNSISSPDSNTIWLLAYDLGANYNYVIRSVNGGVHWDTVYIHYIGNMSEIVYDQIIAKDSLVAWIQGEVGILNPSYLPFIATVDGGRTWNDLGLKVFSVYYADQIRFTDVECKDSFISLLVSGKILMRSKDGGQHWEADTLSQTPSYLDISFSDSLHGWIAGNSGKLIQTTNAGDSWTLQQLNTIQDLTAVYAIDSLYAWAIGSGGTVFRTIDGGTDWDSVLTASARLNALSFPDRNHGWIVGDSGVVIQYRYGSITNVNRVTALASSFQLCQNYPNPFNPTTTIIFTLAHSTYATLKIYNLLGAEVATLVAQELPAGKHTKQWNAIGFATGIYFCRLQIGTLTQVKKLILLR